MTPHEVYQKHKDAVLIWSDEGARHPATTVKYKMKEVRGKEIVLQILNDDLTPTQHTQLAYPQQIGHIFLPHQPAHFLQPFNI